MPDWKRVLAPGFVALAVVVGTPSGLWAQQAASRSDSAAADSAAKAKADKCAAVMQATETELQKKRNELKAQSKDTSGAKISVAEVPGFDAQTVIRCLRTSKRPKAPAPVGQPSATPRDAKPADTSKVHSH